MNYLTHDYLYLLGLVFCLTGLPAPKGDTATGTSCTTVSAGTIAGGVASGTGGAGAGAGAGAGVGEAGVGSTSS